MRAGSRRRRGFARRGMGSLQAGETLRFGTLEVCPLNTPGHTAGMLSSSSATAPAASRAGRPTRRPGSSAAPGGFSGGEAVVFTGDTLFKNSVGGVKAPGHTTYTDLRDSIMGTLMELRRRDRHLPGPLRADDGRAGVGRQQLHPRLARARRRGRRAVHGARRAGHAGAARPGLRRRHQGLGALAGRRRRHRARLARASEAPSEPSSRCPARPGDA